MLYGVNRTLIVNNGKANKGEVNGHVKCHYDEYVIPADLAGGEVVEMGGLLPKGARVLDVIVKSPDLGGTGTIDYGYPVSDDAAEAADADGFAAALDASGQALQAHNDAAAAILKKFASPVQPQLLFTGATVGATGKTVQACIRYIVD
jgi:hypothetical protein